MKRTIFNVLKYDALTKVETHIMQMINNEPHVIVSETISSISEKWNISLPSLTRFSRKIGFDSFSNLRLFVVQRLEQLAQYRLFGNDDPVKNVLGLLELEYTNSIRRTFEDFDNTSAIEALAEKINESSNLLIFGIDMNKPAANIMSEKLSELGINSRFTSEDTLFSSYLNVFSKKAVCIIFSKTLSWDAYKKILDVSDKKKIPVFLITSSKKYPKYKRVLIKTDAARVSEDFVVVNLQIAIVNSVFSVMLSKSDGLRKLEHENWKI